MGYRAAVRRAAALMAAVLIGVGVTSIAVPASAADPCGPGSNPIVCENSKPGTDPEEWDVSGAGSSELQGFATAISVSVGGTIGFKIDTPSTSYAIDIYRTGWYQGLGARHIASVSPSVLLPQTQPQCVWDVTTEMTDCGDWALSASWTVPADAVSGVYIATLRDRAHDWWGQIPFIVKDDSSHADLVFQTSDTTWEAYNPYGGSDFYQGAANGRAYKISYNRPFTTRGDNLGRDYYFSAEYPMVRFLERNGYDVTYQSGLDTERDGSLLLNHKAFLSVGHDEYWSAQQRANVAAARDAGVSLAFFSGNEVYWHTRWEPSIAGDPVDDRTLVSYKETWGNAKIDPSNEWTGTWRDPRFASPIQGAGVPENELSGTLFMSNVTDLPVTVNSNEGKLRFWRDTGLDAIPAGDDEPLAPHTVGYESDETPDNGFSPPGLITMSTVSGEVPAELLDFGNVTGAAETTHHITLYRAASGALVFSAGTIQWSWGLDDTHDGNGAPADPRMQQATVNLFADMGVQPAALMDGLDAATQSTDTTGPTVAIASPSAGAAIANGAQVTVTGTASDVGGVVAAVEASTDGGSTWHPASGVTQWSYTYTQSGVGTVPVQVRAVDDSANIGAPTTVNVSATCPCSVYGSTAPVVAAVDDASALELGLRFTPSQDGFVTGVRFYKGDGNDGPHVGTLWSSDGEALATVLFSGETATGWQTASFSSPVPVLAGQTDVVSYTAPAGHYAAESGAFWYAGRNAPPLSVAGGFGGAPAGVYGNPGTFPSESWGASQYYVDVVFSTTSASPLAITDHEPATGAGTVPVDTPITATFSKPVTSSSLTLSVSGGASVAGTTSYDAASRTMTFTPDDALASDTQYTATVSGSASASDTAGPTSWTFGTAAADQSPGGTTVSFYDDSDTPVILEDADWSPVTLGVRFSSAVNGYITGVRFYKGPNNTGTHVGALWAVGGSQPLAEATFTGETATGWQAVTFDRPVAISKDTQYLASYSTTAGRYSVTVNAFSGTGLQRPPLHTSSDSGAFTYAGGYPGSTSSASYMVDVVFAQESAPLAVVAQSPAPEQLGVAVGAPVSVTFSAALASGARITLAAGGVAVDGSSSVSTDGRTLTFAPDGALAIGTAYTATATGLTSTGGVSADDITWSFTTASASGCPCTLFGAAAPQVTAADDGAAVELGVAFTPATDGLVTGLRFYKGDGNGGTHTGTLWSTGGTALRTVTFTGETGSGWQTATFDTPYPVMAGTTYVVSYLAPQGHYAADAGAFVDDVTQGPLTAPAVGNGRYRYGGGFPTDTWQQTNYFVDVVFDTAADSPPVQPSPDPTPTQTAPASISLWSDADVPTTAAWDDSSPVQVGTRFTTSASGAVTAIKFYKGAANTGAHTVKLWAADGALLASAPSSAESASGWQTVTLPTPITLTPGQVYTAAYQSSGGRYAATPGGLSTARTAGPLSSAGSAYVYGDGTAFPVGSSSAWYGVDVVFQPSS